MTNIVLLVRNRPNLTRQALDSLYEHTNTDDFTLTLVDDCSAIETRAILRAFLCQYDNMAMVRLERSKGHTAMARNLGVYWSEHYWGRGEWLVLSDNDVYFKPRWLTDMTKQCGESGVSILGGCQHPYHKTNQTISFDHSCVNVTDAVAGYSQIMLWEIWDDFGPHVETGAPGVGQSEDWAMCRKIVEAGGNVGYVSPSVVLHTGLTNSLGQKATGWEQFEREKGILYE